jgi:hypothetical protein
MQLEALVKSTAIVDECGGTHPPCPNSMTFQEQQGSEQKTQVQHTELFHKIHNYFFEHIFLDATPYSSVTFLARKEMR